jgi:hypothetical protein
MRGTIAFERLNCKARKGNTVNVRILLNDAVYRKCFMMSWMMDSANNCSCTIMPLGTRQQLPG